MVENPGKFLCSVKTAKTEKNNKPGKELAKINIQRAQQRMKDYYERDATSTWYAVVYTPKTKRGLSRKLLFS